MIHFVTGGARSGKSQFAEDLSEMLSKTQQRQLVYVATATIHDDEMQQRIEQHRTRRDDNWRLVEEPLQLAQCLQELPEQSVVLIDCMTLWLTNWLCSDSFSDFASQKQQFIELLAEKFSGGNSCDCVIVSNEIGSGIVPMGELSRDFVDHAGWLNQALAKLADEASLVVAGLALKLK